MIHGMIYAGAAKQGKKGKAQEQNLEEDTSKPYVYDEFDALPLKQNEGKSIIEFDTLDAALDEFYAKVSPDYQNFGMLVYHARHLHAFFMCHPRGQTFTSYELSWNKLKRTELGLLVQVEGQRAAQAQAQQENAVLSKVEKIRIDQSRRANALEAEAKIEEDKVRLTHMKSGRAA